MQKLPILQAGDTVEIIAPAARCTEQQLTNLKDLLTSWNLKYIVADDIFGEDLLCANSDEVRFKALNRALHNPLTKAIICARGGYGSMRLIPQLAKITPPSSLKLFIGMSDITALHLFFQQKWQWPTLHAALSVDKFNPESISAVKSLIFGETSEVKFKAKPLNAASQKNRLIDSKITGGNLCLVQTGIGTVWQMQGRNKIILLEDVDERGYRIDRMLEHMRQANLFKDVAAIVFGDFVGGKEPDGSSLTQPVLERFAKTCDFPVVKMEGVGHAPTNFPVFLGTHTQMQLGDEVNLVCYR